MTDPKHIHDYLDGALDADGEAALFASLGTDAAGRRELTDQIHLHLAVKKDMAAIAVPIDVTNAIFGELGFPLPSATPAKRKRSVIPWVVVLVLGLLAIQNTEYRIQSTNQESRIQSTNQESRIQSTNQESRSTSRNDREVPDGQRVRAHVPLTPTPAMLQAQSSMQVSVTNAEYDTRMAPVTLAARPSDQEMMSAIVVDTTTATSERSPFSAVIGGLGTVASTPNVGTDVSSNVVFDQFTVGVQYDVTQADRISIVGGRQRIPQEFTRTEFGRDVVYRQAPTLPWIGARYERSFREFGVEDLFTPFASAGAGWMQTGPYARLGLGLHVMPQQQLSFDLGIETTTLIYPIQSNTYTSTTWSIVYGLSYRF
jgi:hypothetical protein